MNDFTLNGQQNLILLVDDLATNLHVLVSALKTDFRLKTATSGASALMLMENKAELPKILILDVKMPGMSGIEVLSKMRNDPRLCDIPVILVSADASEKNELDGLNLGADDYLVKPISANTLIVRVQNLIQRNAERSKLRLASYVFNYSGEAIMITDSNNRILDVNSSFCKMTGYDKAQVLCKNPSILSAGRNTKEEYRVMWDTILTEGYWQGEIWDKRRDGTTYPKMLTISVVRDRTGGIEFYLASFVDISRYKDAEKRIKHLAHHDSLTELPNRLHLQVFLEQTMYIAQRKSERLAVMFLDLDRFKNINDTLGHPIGDTLLIQVATRLKRCMRTYDMVARLGGDEFVVVMRGRDVDSAAAKVAAKINQYLSEPFLIGTHTLRVSTSIGIAIYPDNAEKIDDLMKNADTAMYFAKEDGGNTFRFFLADMNKHAYEKLSMENQLYVALERKEFQLYYQLQLDDKGKPLGAEALIRWIHPERGMVSPMMFIPLAEEFGLILQIGHWVLEQACAQIKNWQENELTRHLVLAVNVSARQFCLPDFSQEVQQIVLKHGINPALLKLEITESLLLKNIEDIISTMNELRLFGIQFSLDDFGTGYSCLQYLKRLPLNQLKIDKSFINDLATDANDVAIVRTIINMAKNMNLDVIAEGVETEKQRAILLSNGCTHFQGYLFSKPVPIEVFEILLKKLEA